MGDRDTTGWQGGEHQIAFDSVITQRIKIDGQTDHYISDPCAYIFARKIQSDGPNWVNNRPPSGT